MGRLILAPWGRLGDEITTIVTASALKKLNNIKFRNVSWVMWYQNRLQSEPLNICEGKPLKFNWRYFARHFDPEVQTRINSSQFLFKFLLALGFRIDLLSRYVSRTILITNESLDLELRLKKNYNVEINVSDLGKELAILGVTNLEQVALRNPAILDFQLIKKVKDPKTICLHIRRGDTVGDPKRGVLDSKYWERAISRITRKNELSEYCLLVFTDDTIGASQTLEKLLPQVQEIAFTPFLDEPARDFVLMANASNLLIANSAFSRWAGVFNSVHNKGRVVSPSQINMIEKGWGLQEWEYVAVSWN